MEASPAGVAMVFTETVTGAFQVNARTVTVLKTKNAFQQRLQAANVKKASNSQTLLFVKILMSVNRSSVTIKPSVSTQLVVMFVKTSSQLLQRQTQH